LFMGGEETLLITGLEKIDLLDRSIIELTILDLCCSTCFCVGTNLVVPLF
jgi:hypothetical protein